MTTIAELRIPAEDFALKDTFETCPDLQVDVLQGVAHSTPGLSNLVWLGTDDHDAVDRALADDDTVGEVANLGDVDGRWLYSIEWNTPVSVAIAVLLEDATILGATGQDESWSFRVLFPQRSALSIAATIFEEYDIDLRIERIYELGGAGEHGELDLTDEQREALEAALRDGYFEIPRDARLHRRRSRHLPPGALRAPSSGQRDTRRVGARRAGAVSGRQRGRSRRLTADQTVNRWPSSGTANTPRRAPASSQACP